MGKSWLKTFEILNIEQGMSNRRSKERTSTFSILYSIFCGSTAPVGLI